jgi:hypothetical protein
MNIVQSLSIALPEILLLIGVSVVLLADVLINGPQIPRDEATHGALHSSGGARRRPTSQALLPPTMPA